MNFEKLKQNAALIVVDMQNCFCHEKGSYSKRVNALVDMKTTKKNVLKLVNCFKQKRHPMFFCVVEFEKDYSNAGLLPILKPDLKRNGSLIKGSWDASLIDELLPYTNDAILIKKNTYDPFFKTKLMEFIEIKNIKLLFICGVLVNVCVMVTAISAFQNGIFPIVVCDATTSTTQIEKEFSCNSIRKHFGWTMSSRNVTDLLA